MLRSYPSKSVYKLVQFLGVTKQIVALFSLKLLPTTILIFFLDFASQILRLFILFECPKIFWRKGHIFSLLFLKLILDFPNYASKKALTTKIRFPEAFDMPHRWNHLLSLAAINSKPAKERTSGQELWTDLPFPLFSRLFSKTEARGRKWSRNFSASWRWWLRSRLRRSGSSFPTPSPSAWTTSTLWLRRWVFFFFLPRESTT